MGARSGTLCGGDTLTYAVKVTLGPRDRNVLIARDYGVPRIAKNEATVAKEIELAPKNPTTWAPSPS
jgi:chaperonin GroEL